VYQPAIAIAITMHTIKRAKITNLLERVGIKTGQMEI
jgi:hypothetical protein